MRFKLVKNVKKIEKYYINFYVTLLSNFSILQNESHHNIPITGRSGFKTLYKQTLKHLFLISYMFLQVILHVCFLILQNKSHHR